MQNVTLRQTYQEAYIEIAAKNFKIVVPSNDFSKLNSNHMLEFIYSEKAAKFCEISTLDLSYVVMVKSTVEILQNFVAFSEYVNFRGLECMVVFFVIFRHNSLSLNGTSLLQGIS